MTHWIIAPVVLPAVLAPILAVVMRYDALLSRVFSLSGSLALMLISFGLMSMTADGTVWLYELGNWPAPFGIVLVLDRLAALMLVLLSTLAFMVLLYVVASGWDTRGRHFHPLFHFLMMGVGGAFLTGDAFNLFVFFEVLLIASYGLMIFGGGAERLQAGLQYVVMNLAGSTLFLVALGTLYATTGTLNIADLAVKMGNLPAGDAALVRVAAVLLMVVFAVKAALFPVQFWLPKTYACAPAAVAALFAIMTKVGVYAILRFYTIAFAPGNEVTGSLAADWLLPGAIITLVLGAVGVLGAKRLLPLASFAVLASMGTLMVAVSLFTPQATLAALYYMIHSTFAAAALFLIADLVTDRRKEAGDWLKSALPMAQNGLLAALFFVVAIAMAGMPPLSGFLGKLMVLASAQSSEQMVLVWATILITSLLMVVGFARAGSALFWKTEPVEGQAEDSGEWRGGPPMSGAVLYPVLAAMLPLAALVALSVLAGPVTDYLQATADQLYSPLTYIDAVLVGEVK
ncbi:monovalent cation/H+ antiporter subunit D [Rhodovibrionaceae bacterium A322]